MPAADAGAKDACTLSLAVVKPDMSVPGADENISATGLLTGEGDRIAAASPLAKVGGSIAATGPFVSAGNGGAAAG